MVIKGLVTNDPRSFTVLLAILNTIDYTAMTQVLQALDDKGEKERGLGSRLHQAVILLSLVLSYSWFSCDV